MLTVIYRFGLKLTITIIMFATIISFTIATTDYMRLREQAILHKQEQVRQMELMASYALETIEKAYHVFGENIALKMKKNSLSLLDLYDQNPSYQEWDFAALKKKFSVDIYLINSENVIVASSNEKDIGLDFKKCCKKLASILDTRRMSGEFYHDGIDMEQATGVIKKYSYIGTRDQQYIIQLGYSLQDSNIFQEFNFLQAIEGFVEHHPAIQEIHVLNSGGFSLGSPAVQGKKLPQERRAAFEKTLRTGETTEYHGEWNQEPAIYRYVRYLSEYDKGTTQTKVLEIIYHEKDLQAILDEKKDSFIFQLLLILIVTVILSFIISRWVARPMYLAFHDSLTGLYNRAAFDELFEKAIRDGKGSIALMMIDLDNFKKVNDQWGHDKGDELLKHVAECIQRFARKEDRAVRLGGDEFVLIMPSVGRQQADEIARGMIKAITASTAAQIPLEEEGVTVSIGIALSDGLEVDTDILYKQADLALYRSKEQGKNRYHFYDA
ncbi:GGDEF domain-containing protein [Brevibacillus ruminantium]|uniref:GGDEF domain-containing protein n=1 Tax=Brevibacillus ruminantium TaxID=2950604 RepID=A0ABY4WHJ0_9BACL|nr:GGDEF domain-containing protein [Brevibacillus ruminantium]USG66613.1 GGDEF domain-containing protein [Brevibacillus ruminantium]